MKLNLKERKGFTLVELMIVVAIIGILAALAIPAFLRYIKQSKTAEAEQNMKKMSEGSKAYFTSEQRYVPSSGDQPWHSGTSTAGATNRFGMPVPWSGYVFPGDSTSMCSHASTGLCSAGAAPDGGSKAVPVNHTNATIVAALNKMRVSFEDPTYFVYNYTPSGTGNTATADISALADFDPNDTAGDVHTVKQSVTIDSVSQEPIIAPAYTVNEFL